MCTAEIAGYLYYFVTCILCIIVALYLLYRLLGELVFVLVISLARCPDNSI